MNEVSDECENRMMCEYVFSSMIEWSVLWHFSNRIVWKSLLMLEFYGHSSVHNKDMLSSYVSFHLNNQLCSQHIWIFTG